MIRKNYCLTFNSYNQAQEILNICKEKKIIPVLFVKHYLINGLGIDWLVVLKEMLEKDFGSKSFKIYVDVKKNYGLFISLVEKKINLIKVEADKEMLKKLYQIAKLNKVLINPNFSILDLSKTKNIKVKLEKYRLKNI